MGDFFNNLVARTLNLAPVVQPRLASRFEPVGVAAPVAPDQSVEVETPTQPSATVRAEAHVDDPKPKPMVIAPTPVEHEKPHMDLQQVINTVRNTHVESHQVVQLPVVEKVHERTHTETRIHTERSTDSRLEIRENRILEPPVEIEKHPLNPRLNVVEPKTVTKEASAPAPQPPIVPRVVTRVEPAPAVKPQQFEVQPAFQAEPSETINVTIGRVDVRAVFSQQATPPVARARTSTVNSLNDYLKQRSEGRR